MVILFRGFSSRPFYFNISHSFMHYFQMAHNFFYTSLFLIAHAMTVHPPWFTQGISPSRTMITFKFLSNTSTCRAPASEILQLFNAPRARIGPVAVHSPAEMYSENHPTWQFPRTRITLDQNFLGLTQFSLNILASSSQFDSTINSRMETLSD